jgi:hypothetical protein
MTKPVEREEGRAARPVEHPAPYAGRFLVAYALLVLAFGGALGALAYAMTRPSSGPAWSSWKPNEDGLNAAYQIADHVSRTYRGTNGDQLVAAQPQRPEVQNVPVSAVAARRVIGHTPGDLELVQADRTLFFVLCGGGTRCALPSGVPAADPLLRRQGLELALYTFKYLSRVDGVVVFLPPPDATSNWALYYRRSDLKRELSRPLGKTLPGKPPVLGTRNPRELATVARLTEPHWYRSSFQNAASGATVLFLDPPIVNPVKRVFGEGSGGGATAAQ